MEECKNCFTCQNCFQDQSGNSDRGYGLTFIVTQGCNMNCPYCWVKKDKAHLTAEQMKLAFDKVKEKGNVSVGFFGGEPLLYFDEIKKFTELVRDDPKFKGFSLTTNGTLVTDEVIDWIKENKVGFILSYDGPLAQKLVRGRENELRPIAQKLGRLPNATLRMTCTKELVPYVPSFIEFGIKAGFKHLVVEPTTGNKEVYDEEALEYFLRESCRVWVQALLNGYWVNYKVIQDGIKYQINKFKEKTACGNSPRNFAFSTDLKFYGCHRYATNKKGQGYLGDLETGIRDDLLKEHIESVDYTKIKSAIYDCETCPANGSCLGGCIAGNLEDNEDKHIASPAFCQWTKTICEIMKDVAKDEISTQLVLKGFDQNMLLGFIWRKVMTGNIGPLEEI